MSRPGRGVLLAAALGGLATVSAPSDVESHARSGQRAVVVQAEDGSAAVLVSFTLPSGAHSTMYLATAALHKPGKPVRDVLRDLMAEQAVSALTILVNGVPATVDSMDSTIETDSSTLGQHTVHVLLNLKVPPAPATLWVTADNTIDTRLTWSDKTLGQVASAPLPQGQWRTASSPLNVTWPHHDEAPKAP